ncbi:MAG: chloride channel protein [Alphaproteobacteria bacterium]|uniref:Chloride channel protein n=1 Tax=Candidatus Nitrobium versatile TaxID=2884831 RepID=A0A953J5E9_9BACT|nr:chloride channel protein [Candidatus Nitrobium versatile]
MELVREVIFMGGSRLLRIDAGGVHRALLPLLPMAGALLLIPLSLLFPGEVNGYTFSRFLEIVNLRGGILRVRNIFLKTLGPALTIGSGGSAGVEGPIAIIGGTVGSAIGRLFRVSENRMKLLIAAGSSGAIAAGFNAPIAGIMFATEIVLQGNYELSSFAAIVISSGIATFVSRGYYGSVPSFSVPQYDLRSAAEIPLYLLLGILMGLLAVLYIRLFHRIREEFEALRLHPQLKPVLGAFMVGTAGIFLPQVMGNGYEFIEDALSGRILVPVIVLLVFFKVLATAVTLGSGGAGGVFAPALFIGAMAGGSFGWVVHTLFPGSTASPGAYATVGIGSFLAAATHAPLTGIFLLFEMTGNYKIIIPLLFTSVIGTLVAGRLYPDSIDTVELTRKGIRIRGGREASLMGKIKVRDTARGDVLQVREETLLRDLIPLMVEREQFYVPVTDAEGYMTGIVSLEDVKPVLFDDAVKNVVTAGQIATEQVLTLSPEDTLNTALDRFAFKDIEEIPVVEGEGRRQRVTAMLRRRDILAAYNRKIVTEP